MLTWDLEYKFYNDSKEIALTIYSIALMSAAAALFSLVSTTSRDSVILSGFGVIFVPLLSIALLFGRKVKVLVLKQEGFKKGGDMLAKFDSGSKNYVPPSLNRHS